MSPRHETSPDTPRPNITPHTKSLGVGVFNAIRKSGRGVFALAFLFHRHPDPGVEERISAEHGLTKRCRRKGRAKLRSAGRTCGRRAIAGGTGLPSANPTRKTACAYREAAACRSLSGAWLKSARLAWGRRAGFSVQKTGAFTRGSVPSSRGRGLPA